MTEGFKNLTPDEQRKLADSALEDGFGKLASALQQVGIVALVSKTTDKELVIINQRQSPLADEEYLRIIHHAVTEICSEATHAYVEAARRALRFDEQEGK